MFDSNLSFLIVVMTFFQHYSKNPFNLTPSIWPIVQQLFFFRPPSNLNPLLSEHFVSSCLVVYNIMLCLGLHLLFLHPRLMWHMLGVLWFISVCSDVLWFISVCSDVLWFISVWSDVLWFISVCSDVLWFISVWSKVLWFISVWSKVLWFHSHVFIFL